MFSHTLLIKNNDDEDDEKLFAIDSGTASSPTSMPSTMTLKRAVPQKSLPLPPPPVATEEEDKEDITFKTITSTDDAGTTKTVQVIKAATLERLIERLAYDTQPGLLVFERYFLSFR